MYKSLFNNQKYINQINYQYQKYLILSIITAIVVAFILKIYEAFQSSSALTNILSTSTIFLINLALSVIFIVILTGIGCLICIPFWIIVRAISFILNRVKGDSFRQYLIWIDYFNYAFIVSEVIIGLYLIVLLMILYLTSRSFLLI